MKNIKLYEAYSTSGEDRPHPASYGASRSPYNTEQTFDWKTYCPKDLVRGLTRKSKDTLDNMPLSIWGEIGPIIEKINYLIVTNNSGGIGWKDILRSSSMLGDSYDIHNANTRERVIGYFRSRLNDILSAGVLKGLQINPVWDKVLRGW